LDTRLLSREINIVWVRKTEADKRRLGYTDALTAAETIRYAKRNDIQLHLERFEGDEGKSNCVEFERKFEDRFTGKDTTVH
jgi:hypothetical protein